MDRKSLERKVLEARVKEARLKQQSAPQLPQALPTEPSMTESALRGAAQGASFGFADELTGMGESLLTDKPYEQARDESRQAYKSAEDANPISSMAGNFAGGIVVPGMAMGKGVAALAKAGAAYGGLSAIGSSDTDLTKPTVEKVKDVSTSAVENAALGAGLSTLLGSAIPVIAGKVKNRFTNDKLGKEIIDTYNFAKQDASFNTPEFLEKQAIATRDLTGELVNLVEKNPKKAINDLYEEAKKNAPSMPVSEIRMQMADALKGASKEVQEEAMGHLDKLIGKTEQQISTPQSFMDALADSSKAMDDKMIKLIETEKTKAANIARNKAQELVDDGVIPRERMDEVRHTFEDKLNARIDEEFNNQKLKVAEDLEKTPSKAMALNYKSVDNNEKVVTQLIKPKEIKSILTETQKELLSGGDINVLATRLGETSQKYSPVSSGYNPNMDSQKAEAFQKLQDTINANIRGPNSGFNEADAARSALGDVRAQLDTKISGVNLDAIKKSEQDVITGLKNKAMKAQTDKTSSDAIKFAEGTDLAKGLQENQPEYMDFLNNYNQQIRKEHLAKQATDSSYLATDTTNFLTTLGRSAKGKGMLAASYAGDAARNMGGLVDKMTNATPEEFQRLGAKLMDAGKPVGKVIADLANKPAGKRKAMVFSLMQQPGVREMIEHDDFSNGESKP